jgi:hypothetical protein
VKFISLFPAALTCIAVAAIFPPWGLLALLPFALSVAADLWRRK